MTDLASSIANTISSINAALAAVPSELEASAPSGDFAAVLASIQEALGSPSASAGLAASSTSSDTSAEDTSSGSTPDPGAVVGEAEQYLGVPYLWGGTSPSGFDCSGFTQYVYAQLGVSLPRTAAEQASVGTPVSNLDEAEPGDLVFFAGADGTASAPGHVGIYLGDGEMIDAPHTGSEVSVQPVSSAGPVVAIRRVVDSSSIAAAPSTVSAVPTDLSSLFASATARYDLPSGLLAAVASVESGDDPTAQSSAGAEGLMQLMPQTAAGLGVDPLDPAEAIDGAAQLLSGYLTEFHSVPLALAAYNAGPAAVEEAGGVPDLAQTEDYVTDVLSQMENPS